MALVDREALRARAVALRHAGKSRREIKAELGITSGRSLDELLRGEPPPEWTKRPNAKDDLRDKACELRAQGWTYREIAGALGVSISSCSLWLRDVPAPSRDGHDQERVAGMWRMRWERILRQREVERVGTKLAAAREIGALSEREVLMAGALIYWCEGAKDKTYRRSERVSFINSDPALIKLFLRFLDTAGVGRERVRFRVHIHETADVGGAVGYWAEVAEINLTAFQRPVIKRHRPNTRRRNVAETYRGCLQISVQQSAELYRKIEGWAYGAMLGETGSSRRWADLAGVNREAV